MRLTGIKLAGFKSFVDSTQFPFPTNMCAVVGPNGSGKSNVIDAVRWVLGESSAKTLRGMESTDMIFSGSKLRKPAGRAAVELQFDNSDGTLQGPYAKYAEIAVRRELTRGGDSQYFLNGSKCLKRDVVDLFLGTGLGGRNQYAILEQGSINRLIDAKPEDLRMWVEEAAGISKSKDRRRETESRIRATRENLSRLADLKSEVTQRLEILQKQAADAEKFKLYKEQERTLRLEVLLLRERALKDESTKQREALEALEAQMQQARQALAEADGVRQRCEAEHRKESEALNACQGEVYQAEAHLAQQRQSLTHAQELRSMRARELRQLENQINEINERATRERERLESLRRAVDEAAIQLSNAEQSEQEKGAAASDAETALNEEQARWDAFLQRAEAPLMQTETDRVRLQAAEREVAELDKRLHQLQQERSGIDAAQVERQLAQADDVLQALSDEIQQTEVDLERVDKDLSRWREQRIGLEATLHESRQALTSVRGRRASLETLQQAALRQDNEGLRNWLQEHGWSGQPQLAEVLNVEPGWETAVEHVLAGVLQAPLVPSLEKAREIAGPESGAVLVADHHAQRSEATGTLSSFVKGPEAIIAWLGGVHTAADAAQAAALLENAPPDRSVITPDGVWRGHGWIRFPHTEGEQTGVLARGLLLKELQAQEHSQSRTVSEVETTLRALRERIDAAERERRDFASRFDQARTRQGHQLAERQAMSVRLEQQLKRIETLEQSMSELGEVRVAKRSELDAVRDRLADAERQAEMLRSERSELTQSLGRAREKARAARDAMTGAAQARTQAQVRMATQTSAIDAATASLQELEQRLTRLRQQQDSETEEERKTQSPVDELNANVQQANEALVKVRDALRESRARLTASEAQLQAAQKGLRDAEARREQHGERLQRARLEQENLRTRQELLNTQIVEMVEHGGLDRDELASGLDPGATPEDWEQKLAQTQRRVERLGAINLAAIQELEETRERADYLGAQESDLNEALTTLEEAMGKLDRETETLFGDTFGRLKELFSATCVRLFGGGEAYLELTGNDLLSAGVRVMVRPPGKRNTGIQMLSGGEKSMVAMGLLFSLFSLNPAPFCLLDEIEAPLDDANVVRFCDLVREMSHQVQFIIITHNKITMESVDHLHGVTMQEPGVSRLVSVDVEQAVRMADEMDEPVEA